MYRNRLTFGVCRFHQTQRQHEKSVKFDRNLFSRNYWNLHSRAISRWIEC